MKTIMNFLKNFGPRGGGVGRRASGRAQEGTGPAVGKFPAGARYCRYGGGSPLPDVTRSLRALTGSLPTTPPKGARRVKFFSDIMMALMVAVIIVGMLLGFTRMAEARKNYTLGVGPVGNIWLFDTFPQLDPGIGGTVFFDYRYNPKFSTEVSVTVTTQDGAGKSAGDGSVEYFAIPTIDFKYYFLDEYGLWDPYAGIGFGFYMIGGGRVNDDSGGAGLGSQIVLGTDYYLTDEFSIGFKGTYHSIGLIHSLNGGTNHDATAVIPYSLTGKIAFHW